MTRVSIDSSRCHSYGLCVAIHPEVFEVPPGNPWAVVIREELSGEDLEDVREAVRACPAQAITLAEDS